MSEISWDELINEVDEICALVFGAADGVLSTLEVLGVDDLLKAPKPNAEDEVLRVKIYDGIFTGLINYFESKSEFKSVNQLLNAKQQLLHLEMLINAVKRKDHPETTRLVTMLKGQARF